MKITAKGPTDSLCDLIIGDDSTDEGAVHVAMNSTFAENAALLQYKLTIQAATEIGPNFAELTPEELIAMFIGGELEATGPREEEPGPGHEMTMTGNGGKGGKGGKGKPKGRSQRRVQEFDDARAQYEEEQYDKELAEKER